MKITDSEQGRVWKETVFSFIKVLSSLSHGETEKLSISQMTVRFVGKIL
jgi:hypothetical protein